MPSKPNSSRDPFAFSLRGLSTINAFVAPPAMPDDRINKILDDRLKQATADKPEYNAERPLAWGRFWLRLRRLPA